MPRRKEDSFIDDVWDLLLHVPWWVAPILAAAVFLAVYFVAPLALPDADDTVNIREAALPAFRFAAWVLASVFLVLWPVAEVEKWRRRRRFDGQTGLDSIRNLSWQAFEQIVAEAYRREDYAVEHTGSAAPDGGIDLVLRRGPETVLVQCKRWKVEKVGVKPVRELLGVLTAHRGAGGGAAAATRAILVTSGRFTPDALAFAHANPALTLIDGPALESLIPPLQKPGSPPQAAPAAAPPICPNCNVPMLARTARKGLTAGVTFWGCPRYPNCRHTRPMTTATPAAAS